MTIFTVTTAIDTVDAGDGKLSLREAVAQANATAAADTIRFAPTLEGKTLTLTGGELVLRQDVTIDGDHNNDGVEVTLDGGDAQRILRTSGAATDVRLHDLTLAHGYAPDGTRGGGALLAGGGSVELDGCTVRENSASYSGSGGAILADAGSRLTIVDSSILGNRSGIYGSGGGISATGSNITIRHSILSDNIQGVDGGAVFLSGDSSLTVEDSRITGNGRYGSSDYSTSGGGIAVVDSDAMILRTEISHNIGGGGGGVFLLRSGLSLNDSTIAQNAASYYAYGHFGTTGGGIWSSSSTLTIANSTVTGNKVTVGGADPGANASGGGIGLHQSSLELANTIVAGNLVTANTTRDPDISGAITFSNGHNIFGSDVLGNVSGDREGIAAAAIFAAIDPETGGGQLSPSGIVPLLNSVANPALSGADPLAASATGQLGGTPRPSPAGSLPDIGAIEINQPLSTTASAHNDVLTGTAGANTINGLAGADYLRGLGGKDTLRGGEGSDLLDGGAGNDQLYGDAGIDLVFYGGPTKVTLDLATGKAVRGGETDTLHDIEGAIGSTRNDVLKGDADDNWFQGGLGKDTFTGKGGRDLYDYDSVAESKPAARDVIKDFAHLIDKIDLTGIDADSTVAGNQAFRWVGKAALSGPGEVGFFTTGGNTIIRASTDADGASEFEIQLTGIKTLTASDFYL